MSADEGQLKYELGPNVRLRLTLAEEMRLDPDGEIFTDELHLKYISMRNVAERQLQATIKGVVYADIGLSLLLFGKNVKIPGIDFGISRYSCGGRSFDGSRLVLLFGALPSVC